MTGLMYVRGCVVHAPQRGSIELFEDAFLSVDRTTGRIVSFHAQTQAADALLLSSCAASDVLRLSPRQFLMPGFVDTHVHAPQFQFMGTATDQPLMRWLDAYTFPVEQSFEDAQVAALWYSKLLDAMLRAGVTTAQYFATIHVQATKILADLVESRGQRALIGLVSMDRNAPDAYVSPSAQQSLEDAEEFVKYALAKGNELVRPVVTPRFVPTCSLQLLKGLGALATKYDVHVQSHIAESLDEEAFVETLHPGRRDTELFEEAGLLTEKSCMAHAVHLKEEELETLRRTGTSIACCPLSNFFFANGLLDLRKVLDKDVDVGLGTDIAGGYSPSMLRAIQTCVLAIKALEMRDDTSGQPFDFKDAFWLATMGGAKALRLENDTGSFAVGKCFDAILVDVDRGGNVVVADRDTPLDVFQKVIHNADDRNFAKIFVKGKVVHEAIA
ncbi:Guanine deaminase [Phytophthora fragariae]|uniref:Guanine deaminase n=1 Tax=Phytophthora fragariae TaxID=53985 RepID=A0A6A3L7X4_9STRA|nr:Guanine deaminase [Phytophthora fragariae]KAE9119397.1 Guanine deaminase [Phytophthora fragariae]